MIDPTYADAMASRVILGPVPCATCGAWVEYAGGAWVALASDALHDCGPYLSEAPERSRVVLTTLGALDREAAARRQQAHPQMVVAEPEDEPGWLALLGWGIAALAVLFMAAWALATLMAK